MTMNRKKLVDSFKRYEHWSRKETENGTLLIGNPHKDKPYWWLIKIFSPISREELNRLKDELHIPDIYSYFLLEYCNGLDLFLGTLSLFGYRRNMIRTPSQVIQQPFNVATINLNECPKNSKQNYFYFGSYNWDGSLIYMDTKDNCIYLCHRYDSTPIFKWNSFKSFLDTEVPRICSLFDDNGEEINPDCSTLPI